MMKTAALLLMLPIATHAQQQIDLTGKPPASLPEPFTSISGVQELSPTLAVATDNMEVKVVLADFGRGAARQVGSKGRGPNEYQYPSPPVSTPRGVYVFDTYQKRGILIGVDGAIRGMATLPDGPLSRVRGSDAAGRVYFEGSDFDPNTGGFSDSLPVVRWDPAANTLETVGRVWGGGRVRVQWNGGPASFAREGTPFPHLDAWVALPDGRIAMIRHEPFRIDFGEGAGRVTAGAPIPVPATPVTARERDWYRERQATSRMSVATTTGGSGPQVRGPKWDDAAFPRTLPPFIGTEVLATPEGQIWIPRSFTSTDRTRRYDIYDGAGKLVGIARLSVHARVAGFGPRSVYVARTNPDDDLVYLDRYTR